MNKKAQYYRNCTNLILKQFINELAMVNSMLENKKNDDHVDISYEELKRSEKKLELLCKQSEQLNSDILEEIYLKRKILH